MKSSHKTDSIEAVLNEAERVIQQIMDSGVAEEDIIEQIQRFRKGFPFTFILKPCTPGDGINLISENEHSQLINIFREAVDAGRVTKFVPASGAATRMFKSLLALYNSEKDKIVNLEGDDQDILFGRTFISSIKDFAFHDELREVMEINGNNLDEACRNMDFRTILHYVLTSDGLNYGNLPKGLIPFHSYPDRPRTPFAEHIAEGIAYAKDNNNTIRIHFTVSPEHKNDIQQHISQVIQNHNDLNFQISYSEQRKQTNTIAVDLKGEGFRTVDERLLFRPAGHGALLINLNDLHGDLVFIKNIDNVAPDHLKDDTIKYKHILGGLLVHLQNNIFKYIEQLKTARSSLELISSIEEFITAKLQIALPENYKSMPVEEKSDWLLSKLNRPIRVCGMVKNQGEPGGGPFWVAGPDGLPAQQIVEKSQVDPNNHSQMECLKNSTHFNPVDIVCGLRDFESKPFDLLDRIDKDTGFISIKSKDGQELKAMELPGLWNGSMADWITVFVEVPLSTFSPVKTVNDLLKPEHQQKLG